MRRLSPAEEGLWRDFVRDAPAGSAYSLHAYLDALVEATGGRSHVLGAFRGDELAGGVGVFAQEAKAGPFVSPRLLLYYNGFVLRDYDTRYPSDRSAREVETLAALAEALTAEEYGRLELRSRDALRDARPLVAAGWRVAPTYSYVVPLTGLEATWARIERNLRRLIERAQAAGLTLRWTGTSMRSTSCMRRPMHAKELRCISTASRSAALTRASPRRGCAICSTRGYRTAGWQRRSSSSSAIR